MAVRRLLPFLTVAWLACDATLPLPTAPVERPAPLAPVLDDFFPRATYALENITITGANFDPVPQNNEVLFEGGLIATPQGDGNSTTTLVVAVPNDAYSGRIYVRTSAGTSNASAERYVSMGYGHPVLGTSVADLRLRHRPVGLVNIPAVVLVASTLFDAVVDDAGRFGWIDGRPVTMTRLPGERALLSTASEAGGRLLLLDVANVAVSARSLPAPEVEHFLLPGDGTVLARTIGVDATGHPVLTRWTHVGQAVSRMGPPVALPLLEVLGATNAGGETYVVATELAAQGAVARLFRLEDDGTVEALFTGEAGSSPTGPVAVVSTLDGPAAVLGLSDGDLATVPLDGAPWRRTRMISFSTVHSLAKVPAAGRVLVTKPGDGAIFQYDMSPSNGDGTGGAFEWSAQLRGEPTFIDVAESIGEIAVANEADNDVDVLELGTGRWLGRSSLSLGLGSADGGAGGVVAPYSYDPERFNQDVVPKLVQVLSRTAPLVLDLDASALSFVGHRVLDSRSPPLRLAVLPDFRTLVVHREMLGVLVNPLEPGDVVDPGERIVLGSLPSAPIDVEILRDGRVLVASATGVDVYAWVTGGSGEDVLLKSASLAVPAGSLVTGLVSHRARVPDDGRFGDGGRDMVLASWAGADGPGGAWHDPAALSGEGLAGTPVRIPAGARGLVGAVDLADGPALLFENADGTDGARFGPALATRAYLSAETGAPLLQALANQPAAIGVSADGLHVIWVTEGAGEHVVRVLSYFPYEADADPSMYGLFPWTGYRLGGRAAGPATDPSGEWLYIPVPALDMVTIVQ